MCYDDEFGCPISSDFLSFSCVYKTQITLMLQYDFCYHVKLKCRLLCSINFLKKKIFNKRQKKTKKKQDNSNPLFTNQSLVKVLIVSVERYGYKQILCSIRFLSSFF